VLLLLLRRWQYLNNCPRLIFKFRVTRLLMEAKFEKRLDVAENFVKKYFNQIPAQQFDQIGCCFHS